jgi:predicted PurR-regulated permease PerM
MYTACAALAIALVVLILPGFRSLWQPWLPIAAMVVSAIAVSWAMVGMLRGQFYAERARCLGGLALAIAAVVLACLAIYFDPARRAKQASLIEMQQRQQMTPEELAQWRRQRLGRYQRRTGTRPRRTESQQPGT